MLAEIDLLNYLPVLVVAVMAVLFAAIWTNLETFRLGYQIERLQKQKETLVERQRVGRSLHVALAYVLRCMVPHMLHGAILRGRMSHGACPQVQRHVERLERELDALAALRTLAADAAPFDPASA